MTSENVTDSEQATDFTLMLWPLRNTAPVMAVCGATGLQYGELLRARAVLVLLHMTLSDAALLGLSVCDHCGDAFDRDDGDGVDVGDLVLCSDDCAHDMDFERCEYCGEWRPADSMIYAGNGMFYCNERCADDDGMRRCADCGAWVGRYDAVYVDRLDDYICTECRDAHYMRCWSCSELCHEDDMEYSEVTEAWYCPDCEPPRAFIYGYHEYNDYSPIGEGLHMGVELETDGGDNEAIASAIDSAFWHGEHDGSLHDGIELISQPMTIEYHVRELPAVAQIARDNGATSHDAGTCGLHVHLSRDYYEDAIGVYGDVLAETRLRVFFASHEAELVKFARRTERQCSSWCKTYTAAIDRPDALSKPHDGQLKELKKAYAIKRANGGDRYLAINGTNSRTIEIRLWRGSLNEMTLLATIALTYALARYVINHQDCECAAVSWKAFTSWALSVKDMPEKARQALRAYLAERAL